LPYVLVPRKLSREEWEKKSATKVARGRSRLRRDLPRCSRAAEHTEKFAPAHVSNPRHRPARL
jgi:hypothetical protein